ncbi:MAG: exonuclease SbcCD subunit D [Candidatus Pacearchaeota archaeon]|nr:exonuclease SbcCD subunit D [Candidatus Pacearchaeota archaeon]
MKIVKAPWKARMQEMQNPQVVLRRRCHFQLPVGTLEIVETHRRCHMVKFAHMSDIHLGGWKQQALQDLNFESFEKAIEISIKEKVDFVLIAGDLFDTAYPPIETLKRTFLEFRMLKEARIPCFIIAGSHDYSVSGKTFLDVLEKAGFCKNAADFEERDGKIILNPVVHEGCAIYGYPGKRSGLEVPDLRRVKFNDAPGMFKIFMLHTTIDKAVGNVPVDAIETSLLPKADYYALGHLHIDYEKDGFVYAGPIFPNNFQELADLKKGRFYIVDTESKTPLRKIDLKLKDVVFREFEIRDAIKATDIIISDLEKEDLTDKIVLLKIRGELEIGKSSDVRFSKIEEFLKTKNAFFMLRNTHDLKQKEIALEIEVKDSDNIEEDTVKIYSEQNRSPFNLSIPLLLNSLSIEKQEGETSETFLNRLVAETKKVLNF